MKTVTTEKESFDSTFKYLNTVVGDEEQKSRGGLLEEGIYNTEKVCDAFMETEVNKSLSLNSILNSI